LFDIFGPGFNSRHLHQSQLSLFWEGIASRLRRSLTLATPQKSFLRIFYFARARIFLLKGKESFLRDSALNEQGGGASLRLGRGRIPPTPPFRLALTWTGEIFCGGFLILFLAPPSQRGKD
jgi:hypothetical protein